MDEGYEGGYPLEYFISQISSGFICQICNCVLRNPKECLSCRNVYCEICIKTWSKLVNKCPNGCSPSSVYYRLIDGILLKMYQTLKMKCLKCSKVLKLIDYSSHKVSCRRFICVNWEFCQNSIKEKTGFCSHNCFLENLKKTKLQHYSIKAQVSKANCENFSFAWKKFSDVNAVMFDDGSCINRSSDDGQSIESFIGNQCPKTVGIVYWEIKIESCVTSVIYVGVNIGKNFSQNSAFWFNSGLAFSSRGKAVSNERFSGIDYGKPFGSGQTVGVLVNIKRGEMNYFINGSNLGEAFRSPVLTNPDSIYPAVAIEGKGFCELRLISGVYPPPSYFNIEKTD